MPPRRRTTTQRRPRVAGTSTTQRPDERAAVAVVPPPARRRSDRPVERPVEDGRDAETVTPTSDEPDLTVVLLKPEPAPAPGTVTEIEPEAEPEAADPAPAPSSRASALWARRVPLLAAALVVLTGVAVLFGVLDARLRGTPAASNTALVDVATTSEVAGQLSEALETIYSYDFARLDENERAAREVITPAFAEDFDALWSQVRELAPPQQAVVSATVRHAAVRSIEGDRAEMVVFIDQQASRVATGEQATQLASESRLTVTGERIDGRWKIADVESRGALASGE